MPDEKHAALVAQIASQFGNVIDLEQSPGVLVEVIRQFGHALDGPAVGEEDDDSIGVEGQEGVSPGGPNDEPPPPAPPDDGPTISSIAVAGPEAPKQVELHELMRAVLDLQKEVRSLQKTIAGQPAPG